MDIIKSLQIRIEKEEEKLDAIELSLITCSNDQVERHRGLIASITARIATLKEELKQAQEKAELAQKGNSGIIITPVISPSNSVTTGSVTANPVINVYSGKPPPKEGKNDPSSLNQQLKPKTGGQVKIDAFFPKRDETGVPIASQLPDKTNAIEFLKFFNIDALKTKEGKSNIRSEFINSHMVEQISNMKPRALDIVWDDAKRALVKENAREAYDAKKSSGEIVPLTSNKDRKRREKEEQAKKEESTKFAKVNEVEISVDDQIWDDNRMVYDFSNTRQDIDLINADEVEMEPLQKRQSIAPKLPARPVAVTPLTLIPKSGKIRELSENDEVNIYFPDENKWKQATVGKVRGKAAKMWYYTSKTMQDLDKAPFLEYDEAHCVIIKRAENNEEIPALATNVVEKKPDIQKGQFVLCITEAEFHENEEDLGLERLKVLFDYYEGDEALVVHDPLGNEGAEVPITVDINGVVEWPVPKQNTYKIGHFVLCPSYVNGRPELTSTKLYGAHLTNGIVKLNRCVNANVRYTSGERAKVPKEAVFFDPVDYGTTVEEKAAKVANLNADGFDFLGVHFDFRKTESLSFLENKEGNLNKKKVDQFVRENNCLLLSNYSGGVLDIRGISEVGRDFVDFVFEKLNELFQHQKNHNEVDIALNVDDLFELFKTINSNRLTNHVSLLRILLYYVPFDVMIVGIAHPPEKSKIKVSYFITCKEICPDPMQLVMFAMSKLPPDPLIQEFLLKCSIMAVKNNENAGKYLIQHIQMLNWYVARGLNYVFEHLVKEHKPQSHMKLLFQSYEYFFSQYKVEEKNGIKGKTIEMFAEILGHSNKSNSVGRPSMLRKHGEEFLVHLNEVLEYFGAVESERLTGVAYKHPGSNAGAKHYCEELKKRYGYVIAPTTLRTYLRAKHPNSAEHKRHSIFALNFRPRRTAKSIEKWNVNSHFGRSDVNNFLLYFQKPEFQKGTVIVSMDVKARIKSGCLPTNTTRASWRPGNDSSYEIVRAKVSDHDFTEIARSIIANGFLFFGKPPNKMESHYHRRGFGMYAVRPYALKKCDALQMILDLQLVFIEICKDSSRLTQLLQERKTFSRFIGQADNGPSTAPKNSPVQLVYAAMFRIYNLDLVGIVAYEGGDSKLSSVERMHGALSKVFGGVEIQSGEGEEGLWNANADVCNRMNTPGVPFCGEKVGVAEWKNSTLSSVPPELVGYIEAKTKREKDIWLDVEFTFPDVLLNILKSLGRPLPPKDITIRKLLLLLNNPEHFSCIHTRFTIRRCGVDGCEICGGKLEDIDTTKYWGGNGFPSPRVDTNKFPHFMNLKDLLVASNVDPEGETAARPSEVIKQFISENVNELNNITIHSDLFLKLATKCLMTTRNEMCNLFDSLNKKIQQSLGKNNLKFDQMLYCNGCGKGKLCLNLNYCESCKKNYCVDDCFDNHANGHVRSLPKALIADLNWSSLTTDGKIDGFIKVTAAMMREYLRSIGKWELAYQRPGFRKNDLLEVVLDELGER